jgi:hypothetical protein
MTTAPRSTTSRKQTHCQRGHLLSEDNVYHFADGHRTCKQCRKDRNDASARQASQPDRRAEQPVCRRRLVGGPGLRCHTPGGPRL